MVNHFTLWRLMFPEAGDDRGPDFVWAEVMAQAVFAEAGPVYPRPTPDGHAALLLPTPVQVEERWPRDAEVGEFRAVVFVALGPAVGARDRECRVLKVMTHPDYLASPFAALHKALCAELATPRSPLVRETYLPDGTVRLTFADDSTINV